MQKKINFYSLNHDPMLAITLFALFLLTLFSAYAQKNKTFEQYLQEVQVVCEKID